jgi:hypothetical protein
MSSAEPPLALAPDDVFADDFERLAGPRTLRGTPRRGQAADMPPSTSNTVPEM